MGEIVELVKQAGVCGAGGAGFPTHVKLAGQVEYVIANGAECEPLLQVGQQLMVLEARGIVAGLRAAMEATGASQGIIALKAEYRGAIAALEKELGAGMRLFLLPDFYPAGDEQVLVYEVTGRLIPEGEIPLQVGVLVNNVETLLNVHRALAGQPVTDKYVSILGGVKRPVTVRVPVGTAIVDLVEEVAGAAVSRYAIIEGGPMMGNLVTDPLAPVTKTTGGLIVLPEDHPLVMRRAMDTAHMLRQAKVACVQCSMCTELCPRYLLGHSLQPHRVMRAVMGAGTQQSAILKALLCSECGVCDLACPMGLSPSRVNASLKRTLVSKGVRRVQPSREMKPHPMRAYRRLSKGRVTARLVLRSFEVHAPFVDFSYQPKAVRLLLKQHAGAPSRPVVSAGDSVERGQVVAEIPEGAWGTAIHASIGGTVKEVTTGAIVVEAY